MRERCHLNGRKGLLLASTFISFGMVPTAVSAQEQKKDAESQAATEVDRNADIIVTAQRRNESVQDIPFSISAIGEKELRRRNIQSLGDYAASVPGVSYIDEGPTGTRGDRTLIIRGISSQNTGGTIGQGTVGYYIDETPVPVLDPQIFDIDRIEILKGPQSTLYGAGSVGGTFRIITNKPVLDRVEGRGELQLETTDSGDPSYGVRGAINLPVVRDIAAIRVVGWYNRKGGWVDNYPLGLDTPANGISHDWNKTTISGGRVTALAKLSDRLSLTPMVMFQEVKEEGSASVDPRLGGYRSRTQIDDPFSKESFQLYSLVARYDLGFAELTSSTSKFDRKVSTYEDSSGNFGIPIPPEKFADKPDQELELTPKNFTQEVRLVSPGNKAFHWIAGLFYTNSKLNTFFKNEQAGIAPEPLLYQLDATSRVREKAVYGEISFDITDRFTVAAGARYFDVKTAFTNKTKGFFGGGAAGQVSSGESHESGIRPKAYISYDTGNVMIYGTASQGFRAGGGLVKLPQQCDAGLKTIGLFPQPTSFKSDSVWNYEVGIKSAWLDRRLIANAAVFYLDWKDIQQTFGVGSGCPFQITANTGSAVSKGFELDTTVVPTDGLSLELALGYTDAKIADPPPAGTQKKGDPLLNVPNLNVHAAAQYEFPLGSLKGLARIDYTFVDTKKITFDPTTPVQQLRSFDMVNARLGLTRDRWSATFSIENLFNVKGETDYGEGAAPPGAIQVIGYNYIRPRTIEVTLSTQF